MCSFQAEGSPVHEFSDVVEVGEGVDLCVADEERDEVAV